MLLEPLIVSLKEFSGIFCQWSHEDLTFDPVIQEFPWEIQEW